MRLSWHKGFAYAWQKLMCNDAKVRWLLASTMHTKPFSQVGMREEKPPLKLHYRLSFLQGYRKLEWTLAYRSCGTKERERERLRWTPSYVNSNQLNGVGGDETSLSGGPRERARRMTFHVFHDSYESYWLVYVKEIVKYDWQIGGGSTWGLTGPPSYL